MDRRKSIKDGRTALGIKNRKALLTSAESIFQHMKYQDVTINDIVKKAGLAIGTFYNHFDDKESIFLEILEIKKSSLLPVQHRLRDTATSFEDLISSHFLYFFEQVATDPAYFELYKLNSAYVHRVVSSPIHMKSLELLSEDLEFAVRKGLLVENDTKMLAAAIKGIAMELGTIFVEQDRPNSKIMADYATKLITGKIEWVP